MKTSFKENEQECNRNIHYTYLIHIAHVLPNKFRHWNIC